MTVNSLIIKIFVLLISCICSFESYAQSSDPESSKSLFKEKSLNQYREVNVFEVGAGTSFVKGDLPDQISGVDLRVGYKRSVLPHLNIGVAVNKFNLAFDDIPEEDFMSFDLNFEYVILPYNRFSPYVFVGTGYNASDNFKMNAPRFQGGGGIEVIVARQVGLKVFSDYNYVLSGTFDGKVFGGPDDAFWRILFGVNVYLGSAHQKDGILKGVPSIMNSNPIIKEN